MSVSFCLPHPVAVSAFIICSGLCACTEMLWMCVLYVSFGSKVRPRTFGCVAMRSAKCLFFSPGCYCILQGLEWTECKLFCLDLVWDCFVQEKTLCRYGSMYLFAALVLVCVDVMVMPPRRPWPELVLLVVVCLHCICWIVLVKGRHLVERQVWIDVVRMCDLYMLCRLCVPWCSLRWT